MDPLTIGLAVGLGTQVVSGLMQYYNAEKERGATRKRLKEIEAMFDAIVPPEFNVKIFDDPRLAESIPLPALNLQAITPEQYRVVGQFVPAVASFMAEANPQLVQATEVANQGRSAQMEALQRFRQKASGEFDPELQQMLLESSDRARGEAQSRQASILQDAARRGQLGSGVMMGSQMQAAGDAMRTNALESQRAAAEAYRNRMAAAAQAASLGGQIRQSEMSEQARNADIINAFNERTSQRYQNWAQYAADQANRAQTYNLDRAQRVADANVQTGNDFARYNREMYNQGQGTLFDARRAQKQDILSVEAARNAVLQQRFANDIAKAQGRAGIAQAGIQANNQFTRDQNQAIQGVGDAASKTAFMAGRYYQPGQPEPEGPAPRGTPRGTGYAPSSPYVPGNPLYQNQTYAPQRNPYSRDWTFDDYMNSGVY
jgi:hypothetical protein